MKFYLATMWRLVAIVAICFFVATSEPVAAKPASTERRFDVVEAQDEKLTGLFVIDRKTHRVISIVADRSACFIAFYGADDKSNLPGMAIGCDGLQIKTKDGSIRLISPDELAGLDTDSPLLSR